MSRAFPSERKKRETNSGPRSEVTCSGTPCLEKTWRINKIARSSDVQWTVVGIKMPCLVKRSTTTRIASCQEDVGRVSMKSIEMEFHGCCGTGSCFNNRAFSDLVHQPC